MSCNCKEVAEYLSVEQLRRMVWEKLSYNDIVRLRNELDEIIECNRRAVAKGLQEQLTAICKRAEEFDLVIINNKIYERQNTDEE